MNRILSFVLVSASIALLGTSATAAEIHHAQGELAGEVTATSVLLQSRLTALPGPELDEQGDIPGASGLAAFEWYEAGNETKLSRTEYLKAEPEHDYIVRAEITGLRPGTRYNYRLVYVEIGVEDLRYGPVRQFRTLPAATSDAPLSFCMGSCQNYAFFMHGANGKGSPATDEDKRLGYPSYAAMLALKPDFFIGTGDIVYYDHPAKTAAKTLPELRRKWHEQFRFPRMIDFFARTPAYWSKDDHDFRFNDADLSGEKLPLQATGIEIFREQMPIHPAGEQRLPTYRTHRVHKHLQLWFTEGRDYRSPNKQPDGPEKTLWGAEQRAWLMQTLKASDATWKIIITPTPMVGPDRAGKRDSHANLEGFRHEATAFFEWLRDEKLTNVMTFCGDRHWQYHSIHPLGLEEFSCGALNDENAIAGTYPGTKGSTDPEGLIRQPFHYPKPSGGFLHVTVDGATQPEPRLTIRFRDDAGKLQYQVEKTPIAQPASK
jgi:alkaline phosphatase D